MRRLRFLAGVAVGFILGVVPPELIAWLRGTPELDAGPTRSQRSPGKRRPGRPQRPR